jgi:hypothetical protein
MRQWITDEFFLNSQLSQEYRDDLETLFFFNPNQHRIRGALRKAAESYGTPQIRQEGDWLLLDFGSPQQAQSLFLFREAERPKLAGVVVYTREVDYLRVLYVGLKPEFSRLASGEGYLLVDLFAALLAIARRIRGVAGIEYTMGQNWLRLHV